MSDELKPCPFCGNKHVNRKHDDGLSWEQCTNCGATGPAGTRYADDDAPTWNSRYEVTRPRENEYLSTLQKRITELEQQKLTRFLDTECWIYMGDGSDYPESLVCPVVMSAQQFRDLLREWKPIETAPKDVKYIIGGWWDHGWNIDQCFLSNDGKWLANNRADGGAPTHWIPWIEPDEGKPL